MELSGKGANSGVSGTSGIMSGVPRDEYKLVSSVTPYAIHTLSLFENTTSAPALSCLALKLSAKPPSSSSAESSSVSTLLSGGSIKISVTSFSS